MGYILLESLRIRTTFSCNSHIAKLVSGSSELGRYVHVTTNSSCQHCRVDQDRAVAKRIIRNMIKMHIIQSQELDTHDVETQNAIAMITLFCTSQSTRDVSIFASIKTQLFRLRRPRPGGREAVYQKLKKGHIIQSQRIPNLLYTHDVETRNAIPAWLHCDTVRTIVGRSLFERMRMDCVMRASKKKRRLRCKLSTCKV